MNDRFDLQRFVEAQAPAIDRARAELRQGRKTSHWMWFVFPQIAGLGNSSMSQRYAISSLEEAKAYWAHPVLGTRLKECTGLVLAVENRFIAGIFGYPDDMKFQSCMTLFSQAAPDEAMFTAALRTYFRGEPDPRTLEILAAHHS